MFLPGFLGGLFFLFWAVYFDFFFYKITPKLQNKCLKKGEIGLPKSPAKTRLGGARSAPPNLVLLMRAFWEAYFSFFGALILQFWRNFTQKILQNYAKMMPPRRILTIFSFGKTRGLFVGQFCVILRNLPFQSLHM